MRNNNYSETFKKQAVLKFINRGTKTVEELSKQLNTRSANLYRWYNDLNGITEMNKKQKKSKPDSMSSEEKLKVIAETLSLPEHELGEYLRKHGLHSSDIKEWKENCLTTLKPVMGRPKKDPEIFELRKDKKDLEHDLRRKEKALAEMSARVVLLKKSREIFGDEEDDE